MGSTLIGQYHIVPLLLSLCITCCDSEKSPASSANFVCKDNDFFWLYVRFAQFSCRICLFFMKFKQFATSKLQIFVSIKRKMDGFWHRRFRFKFRYSYIYNKVWKTQIGTLMSLKYWVRCSCIYTWVNLNLKRIVSAHNPFLLTEEYHSPSHSSLPY